MRATGLILLAVGAVASLADAEAHGAGQVLDRSSIPKVVPRAFQTKCASILPDSTHAWTLEQYHLSHPNQHHQYNWLSAWIIGGPRIWNWEPVCIHDAVAGSQCVYTSTHFADGRGLSLITSPAQEKLVITANIFKDATAGFKPLIVGWGNLKVADSRIKREHFPNKGIGMVATQTIFKGDMIYATTPLCALDESFMNKATRWLRDLGLEIAVERLPRESRDLYMSQIGSMGGNKYYDKADTNAFNNRMGVSDTRFWCIYPESARLNHDCRPNSSYSTNPQTMVHAMTAVRTIYPGEEVTTSYISPYYIWKDRQYRASQYWGFNCTCNLCAAPEHIITDSDNRLLRINAIEKQLVVINFGTVNRTGWTEKAELLVSLYEQERLYGAIAEAYALATFEYAYVANKHKTQAYAAKALQALMLWRGAWNNAVLTDIVQLLENPEQNGFWGYAAAAENLIAAGRREELVEAEMGFTPIAFGSGANGVTYELNTALNI